jgi:ribosome-associated toxin RatA of RatAB toxin-antitoxin module
MRAFLVLALLLSTAAAEAKTKRVDTRRADFHIPTLAKLAAQRELALIETLPSGECKQVVMFAVLDARPEKVWDVIMDVASYPKFIDTVVRIDVVQKAGETQVMFDWEIDIPFFNLEGRRKQRGKKPQFVEVRGMTGHLKGSHEAWELFPIDGGKRTLVAFYRALDTDSGGVLLKTMIDLEPSMEQGANLATGFVHLRQLEQHVESAPKSTYAARSGEVPPFSRLSLDATGIDLGKLAKLLRHGQLALIESYPDGALKQVALLAEVNAPTEKMAKIVQDPAKYPEFIPNFAEQKVTPAGDGKLKMEWELEVPMVNLTGTSMMTIEKDGSVDVVAVEGDIKRGRWRWEFNPRPNGVTIPVHYAYSDVREASWVTKMIVDRQPLFEHGIVIASGTVAMHAMKARAEGKR